MTSLSATLIAAFTLAGNAQDPAVQDPPPSVDMHIDLRWSDSLIELQTDAEIGAGDEESLRGWFMVALNDAVHAADDDLRVSARVRFAAHVITITTTLPNGEAVSTKYVGAAPQRSSRMERDAMATKFAAYEQPYASSGIGGCILIGGWLAGQAGTLVREEKEQRVRKRMEQEDAGRREVRAAASKHVSALLERLDRLSVVKFSDDAFSMDDHPELRARILHILNGPRATDAQKPHASTSMTVKTTGAQSILTMTTQLPSRRTVITQREDGNNAQGRLRTAWLHARDVAAVQAVVSNASRPAPPLP